MINIQQILNYVAYWVLFWTIVNIILPPREIFENGTPSWYNTLLKLVAYYGALNLRQVSVKLYSAVSQQAPADPIVASLQHAQEATKAAVSLTKDAVGATKDAVAAVADAKDVVVAHKEEIK